MELSAILKLMWYTFNATLSYVWVKNRIMMDAFLTGKWKGSFHHRDSEGNIIDGMLTRCILIVSGHQGKNDSAYLYYELHDVKDDKLIAKGFDELIHYESYWNFVIKRKWNPKFCRLIHKTDGRANTDRCIYDFDCDVTNIFFKPRMSARVAIEGDRYLSGYLEKS